jgi:hypothetical protein
MCVSELEQTTYNETDYSSRDGFHSCTLARFRQTETAEDLDALVCDELAGHASFDLQQGSRAAESLVAFFLAHMIEFIPLLMLVCVWMEAR